MFSLDLAIELLENTGINENIIKLVEEKQASYSSIYTISPVELETVKTNIKTHLRTDFIQSSKFPAGAPILINKKLNSSI